MSENIAMSCVEMSPNQHRLNSLPKTPNFNVDSSNIIASQSNNIDVTSRKAPQSSPKSLFFPLTVPKPPKRRPSEGGFNLSKGSVTSPLRFKKQPATNGSHVIMGSTGNSSPVSLKAPSVANHIPSDPNQICRVCDGRASGLHFGEYTCESCKLFFLRQTKQDNQRSVCPLSWNCDISHHVKSKCRACRFKKCCEVGMSKDRVVYGRNARAKPSTTAINNTLHTLASRKIPTELSAVGAISDPCRRVVTSLSHQLTSGMNTTAVLEGSRPHDSMDDFITTAQNSPMRVQSTTKSLSLKRDHQHMGDSLGPPKQNLNQGASNDISPAPHIAAPVANNFIFDSDETDDPDLFGAPGSKSNQSAVPLKMESDFPGQNPPQFCKLAAERQSNSSQSSPNYHQNQLSPIETSQSPTNRSSNHAPNCISPQGSFQSNSSSNGCTDELQEQFGPPSKILKSNRAKQSDGDRDSSGSESNDQIECWSVIAPRSESSRSTTSGRIIDLHIDHYGGMSSSHHHISQSSYINNQLLVQRAVMSSLGQHFSPAQSQNFPSNGTGAPSNLVHGSFIMRSNSSGTENNSCISGNSSGSESSDDRSIEFTGPEGYMRNNLINPRLPFSTHSASQNNVSELWLELPNLEFVCKYCFLSPCYCFGERKS